MRTMNPRPDYRLQTASLLSIAETARNPETRRQLLELAALYQRRAETGGNANGQPAEPDCHR